VVRQAGHRPAGHEQWAQRGGPDVLAECPHDAAGATRQSQGRAGWLTLAMLSVAENDCAQSIAARLGLCREHLDRADRLRGAPGEHPVNFRAAVPDALSAEHKAKVAKPSL